MNIKVGDKVKFLNSVGGGKVKRIIDKKTVGVFNQDGFEIPVLIKELIKIDEDEKISGNELADKSNTPFNKTFKKEPEAIVEEKEDEDFFDDDDDYKKDNEDLCLYLGFLPKDENKKTNCDVELYLINDSNYSLYFNIIQPSNNKYFSLKNGFIEDNIKEFMLEFERSELNNLNELIIQVIPFKNEVYNHQSVIDKTIKINPVKFFKYKSYKENDFFDEEAFVVTVFEENMLTDSVKSLDKNEIKQILTQKEVENKRINQPKRFKKSEELNEVVDLHIHELIDDEKGLSNAEMLEIQLKTFKKRMDEAIKKKSKSIVFIHGIGNGKLKMELRRELDRQYKKYSYQDASFREYGWGATMVIL